MEYINHPLHLRISFSPHFIFFIQTQNNLLYSDSANNQDEEGKGLRVAPSKVSSLHSLVFVIFWKSDIKQSRSYWLACQRHNYGGRPSPIPRSFPLGVLHRKTIHTNYVISVKVCPCSCWIEVKWVTRRCGLWGCWIFLHEMWAKRKQRVQT